MVKVLLFIHQPGRVAQKASDMSPLICDDSSKTLSFQLKILFIYEAEAVVVVVLVG